MEINTMEIGKMIKGKDKENLLGKVETFMKVYIIYYRSMERQ